ncbi:MAG TPA: hypothetical protein VGJ07_31930, partial [Rugosimonospora sp.]
MTGALWSPGAAHRRQWWLRRTALGEGTAVVRNAAVILFRHWPVLFMLAFAGLGARSLLLSGAVRASKVNAGFGFMVAVLVPMTTLTALVLMMRAIRGSLPWLLQAERGPAGAADPALARDLRAGTLLNYLGSVLVPFLAVYASYGYLKDDISSYTYAVLYDAVFNNANVVNGGPSDVLSRLPFSPSVSVVTMIVIAVVIRWALGKWHLAKRYRWLGIIGAYVEIIWISLVAGLLSQASGSGQTWVEDRRVVHGLTDTVNAFVDRLGPFAKPGHHVLSIAGNLLDSVDKVIVVPVSWLAVGAVVYGYKITKPAPLTHEMLDLANQRWSRLPGLVRKVGAEIGSSVRERFGPLAHGLRLLIKTGLRPMLLFCLAFLVVQSASDWMWEVERWAIGPQNLVAFWTPLSEVLSPLNNALGMALLVALLGAAVDRVLRAQEDEVPVPRTASAAVAPAAPTAPVPAVAVSPVAVSSVAAASPVAAASVAPAASPVAATSPLVAAPSVEAVSSVAAPAPAALAPVAVAPVAFAAQIGSAAGSMASPPVAAGPVTSPPVAAPAWGPPPSQWGPPPSPPPQGQWAQPSYQQSQPPHPTQSQPPQPVQSQPAQPQQPAHPQLPYPAGAQAQPLVPQLPPHSQPPPIAPAWPVPQGQPIAQTWQ